MPAPAGNSVLACVGLGSNVGDRHAHLAAAVAALRALPNTTVVAVSDTIETEPVGPVSQGPFLNAAASLRTTIEPRELLNQLLSIERHRGRDRAREQRWGPRTLDLDLLLYGDRIINEPGLSIPHPRLHERTFVLIPLSQIAPEVVVATLGRSIRELALALA